MSEGIPEGKEGVKSCGAWIPKPTHQEPAPDCHPLTGAALAACNLPIMGGSAGPHALPGLAPTFRTRAISQALTFLLARPSLTRAAVFTWATEFQSMQEPSLPYQGLQQWLRQ